MLTLSFEKQGNKLKVDQERRSRCIAEIVARSDASIVLTAGDAFERNKDWMSLVETLKATGWQGLIVSEIDVCEILRRNNEPKQHAGVACVISEVPLDPINFGKQCIEKSEDTQSSNAATILDDLCKNLEERTIEFSGERFGFLNCGEINLIRGRIRPTPVDERITNWLGGLKVIFNPTHDAMGNHGTLKAKRKWLSEFGNQSRIYISASNWNTGKKLTNGTLQMQKRDRETLHSVWQSGKSLSSTTLESEDCEARVFQLG